MGAGFDPSAAMPRLSPLPGVAQQALAAVAAAAASQATAVTNATGGVHGGHGAGYGAGSLQMPGGSSQPHAPVQASAAVPGAPTPHMYMAHCGHVKLLASAEPREVRGLCVHVPTLALRLMP